MFLHLPRSEETIERLRCRVVCGGANNPLADPDDGERLRERGILYVPGVLANATPVRPKGEVAVVWSRMKVRY